MEQIIQYIVNEYIHWELGFSPWVKVNTNCIMGKGKEEPCDAGLNINTSVNSWLKTPYLSTKRGWKQWHPSCNGHTAPRSWMLSTTHLGLGSLETMLGWSLKSKIFTRDRQCMKMEEEAGLRRERRFGAEKASVIPAGSSGAAFCPNRVTCIGLKSWAFLPLSPSVIGCGLPQRRRAPSWGGSASEADPGGADSWGLLTDHTPGSCTARPFPKGDLDISTSTPLPPWRTDSSMSRVRKEWCEDIYLCQKARRCSLYPLRDYVQKKKKRHRRQLEGGLTRRIWDHLSLKMNKDREVLWHTE